MTWFYLALLAPALWGVANHIDKYLISNYFKGGGEGSLIIFSSLIGAIVMPIIYFIHPDVTAIEPRMAILILLNGFLYILGLLPYLWALALDEASIVIALFQMVPVFSYLLGYLLLGENLNTIQVIAAGLIISGAVGITLDLTSKQIKLKTKVFGLMAFSSFLVALNGIVFKMVAISADFWTTSFWEYSGFVTLAILLLIFVKKYREQFFSVIKLNKVGIIGLNGVNEVLNVCGKMLMNAASLLAPVSLVWAVNGFQPIFVFIYGIILTLFLPHIGKENIEKKQLIQKVISIFVALTGTWMLNR